jgi:hypothetical protein
MRFQAIRNLLQKTCPVFIAGDIGQRTDSDAINVPFGAKSQCRRIAIVLMHGGHFSNMELIRWFGATSAPARGREVRTWLREHGITVTTEYRKAGTGARYAVWWLDYNNRAKLRAIMEANNG